MLQSQMKWNETVLLVLIFFLCKKCGEFKTTHYICDILAAELADNIKSYGTYSVTVKLYTDISGKFTVVVHE